MQVVEWMACTFNLSHQNWQSIPSFFYAWHLINVGNHENRFKWYFIENALGIKQHTYNVLDFIPNSGSVLSYCLFYHVPKSCTFLAIGISNLTVREKMNLSLKFNPPHTWIGYKIGKIRYGEWINAYLSLMA